MTESEFKQRVEAILLRIENAFDHCAADIDCSLNGGVLEIEFADGAKIIINQHTPNQEIWLAAKSGAFHFSLQEERWLSLRDGRELFSTLAELILRGSGEVVSF